MDAEQRMARDRMYMSQQIADLEKKNQKLERAYCDCCSENRALKDEIERLKNDGFN